VKTFVQVVALYGSEAWIIGKSVQKRIEAFETRCWRMMLRMKWTEKVGNEEVYTEESKKITGKKSHRDVNELARDWKE
jgi:hypothetical protein